MPGGPATRRATHRRSSCPRSEPVPGQAASGSDSHVGPFGSFTPDTTSSCRIVLACSCKGESPSSDCGLGGGRSLRMATKWWKSMPDFRPSGIKTSCVHRRTRLRGHHGRPEDELPQLAPHRVRPLLVEREPGARPRGLVLRELLSEIAHSRPRLRLDPFRGDCIVERVVQAAGVRPGPATEADHPVFLAAVRGRGHRWSPAFRRLRHTTA